MNKKQIEKLEEFLSKLDTEVAVLNCIDIDNIESFDDIYDQIDENQGFDIEIIYYSNAMEYLTDHDTSLCESLQLAALSGYEIENLNSELLASLLASVNAKEEFYGLKAEIENFLNDLKE